MIRQTDTQLIVWPLTSLTPAQLWAKPWKGSGPGSASSPHSVPAPLPLWCPGGGGQETAPISSQREGEVAWAPWVRCVSYTVSSAAMAGICSPSSVR